MLEKNNLGKTIKIHAGRYEFWIYRQIRKRLKAGELYLDDSIHHRSLNDELVSLSDQENKLKQLDIPALRDPITNQLDELFHELHTLLIDFNNDLMKGKLKHIRYDESTKTLHIKNLNKILMMNCNIIFTNNFRCVTLLKSCNLLITPVTTKKHLLIYNRAMQNIMFLSAA